VIRLTDNRRVERSGRRGNSRGQSILEFALTMPVLLVIVAGVLEASNLLVTYNRVQLAAREASRFGAAGGSGGFVPEIVFQASQDSLFTDEDHMTVFVIRPVVREGGGIFYWEDWAEECVYGSDEGCDEGSGLDPGRILNEVLQIDDSSVAGASPQNVEDLKNSRVTVVAIRYRADTILNLSFWDTGADAEGRVPLTAYTITRQEIEQAVVGAAQSGCSAFPIAIYSGQIAGGEGYEFTPTNNDTSYDGFEFLAWRAGDGISDLVTSLQFPGNSSNYQEPGSDPIDVQLHRGDKVAVNGEMGTSSSSVWNALDSLIDPNILDSTPGYTLRVIVYDDDPGLVGTTLTYTITNFAIVQVRDLPGSPNLNWIKFRFLRYDTSCGYDIDIDVGF
jgi:hypothetical protein